MPGFIPFLSIAQILATLSSHCCMTAACARQISEIHIILIKDGGSLQTFGVGGEGGAVLNPSVDHRLNQCRLHVYILVHYTICYCCAITNIKKLRSKEFRNVSDR